MILVALQFFFLWLTFIGIGCIGTLFSSVRIVYQIRQRKRPYGVDVFFFVAFQGVCAVMVWITSYLLSIGLATPFALFCSAWASFGLWAGIANLRHAKQTRQPPYFTDTALCAVMPVVLTVCVITLLVTTFR